MFVSEGQEGFVYENGWDCLVRRENTHVAVVARGESAGTRTAGPGAPRPSTQGKPLHPPRRLNEFMIITRGRDFPLLHQAQLPFQLHLLVLLLP